MIADPPLETGAAKATLTLVAPVFVATTEVGAPGTVESVRTELDAVDDEEIPKLLVAFTVNE